MSALYPKFKEAILSTGVNLLTADVRVVAVDSADYTYSSAHEFLTSVPAAARVGTAVTLANKTVTNGIFDADPTTIPSVTGDPFEALVLYVHTGTDSTSRLIAYIDGISFTPNGGNAVINWSDGASRIFAL